jgi:hypothetical protein
MTKCKVCGREHDRKLRRSTEYSEFCSRRCRLQQYYVDNKQRQNQLHKQYYQDNKHAIKQRTNNNRESIAVIKKQYYQDNKTQISAQKRARRAQYNSEHREYLNDRKRQYRLENKDIICQQRKARRGNDINHRLRCDLRSRTGHAIRRGEKSGSAVRDLGCTIAELKTYLESKFLLGMSWGNWSQHGWHIDHILPLSSFDLTDRSEFLKACHYTNLQPLWAEDNLKKSDTITV